MRNILPYFVGVGLGLATLACSTATHKARESVELVVRTGNHEVYTENDRVVDSYYRRVPITKDEQDRLNEVVITISRLIIDGKESLIVARMEAYNAPEGIYLVTQRQDGIPDENLPLDGKIDRVIATLVGPDGIIQRDLVTMTPRAKEMHQADFEADLEKVLEEVRQ